ncbi:hypothetical protein VNO78_21158 [Psophocarpus tetragonolobus]|uniref:Agamous-like MADS-box protein AGL62 n=1 Tax=Psophocarpus tetragonolobus TaxID=3891 RepID=A0AAN9SG18_PSOTE
MDSRNIPNLNEVPKKTKGRQKIEMKKISNERKLRVAFSKRRTGIVKKASELATLCGVDLAVIMFSPSNQVFSFGTPNVESVIQRYMAREPHPIITHDLNQTYCTEDEAELRAELNRLNEQIAAEKKRKKHLNQMLKASRENFWWATPIKKMNKAQLENYKKLLDEVKACLTNKREKLLFEKTLTKLSSQFFAGEGSSSSADKTNTPSP